MDASTNLDVVKQTWNEVGFKVRPMHAKVFVRTDPPAQKIGMIFLPPKEAGFFGGMMHLRLVTATVLSVGSMARLVKPGDRVVFQRMNFGHIRKLENDVYVGWIEEQQLIGHPEGSEVAPLKA